MALELLSFLPSPHVGREGIDVHGFVLYRASVGSSEAIDHFLRVGSSQSDKGGSNASTSQRATFRAETAAVSERPSDLDDSASVTGSS